MLKKCIVLILVLFVFNVYWVTGIDFVNDLGKDYEKFSSKVYRSETFFPVNEVKYRNNITDELFEVQLTVFNKSDTTKSAMDDWITIHVNEAQGTFDISGNTIFINYNNKYVFWKNNEIFIKISEEYTRPTAENDFSFIRSIGTANFNEEIILKYLNIYPSDCDEDGCRDPPPLEELYKFDYPSDIYNKVDSYDAKTYSCPDELSVGAIITKVNRSRKIDYLSKGNFEEMLDQCKEGTFFRAPMKEIEPWLEECMTELSTTLDNDNVPILNNFEEDLIEECYILDYFSERYNSVSLETYDEDEFDLLFDKRKDDFVDFMLERVEIVSKNVVSIVYAEGDAEGEAEAEAEEAEAVPVVEEEIEVETVAEIDLESESKSGDNDIQYQSKKYTSELKVYLESRSKPQNLDIIQVNLESDQKKEGLLLQIIGFF